MCRLIMEDENGVKFDRQTSQNTPQFEDISCGPKLGFEDENPCLMLFVGKIDGGYWSEEVFGGFYDGRLDNWWLKWKIGRKG